MNQPLSVVPDAAALQPAGERSSRGAAAPAAPERSDLALLPLPDLLRFLHSTDAGLSKPDAAATLEAVGPNRIESSKPKHLLTAFVERFHNPLVLILLFAAAVSAFTGDVPSFVIIAAIVLMSVILDVTQERQAQNAAERLRERVSLSATTIRDGQPVDVPVAEIVPGDIVLLAAGFPADRSPRPLRR